MATLPIRSYGAERGDCHQLAIRVPVAIFNEIVSDAAKDNLSLNSLIVAILSDHYQITSTRGVRRMRCDVAARVQA